MTTIVQAQDANSEAIAAWDGPLYERFVEFREIVTTGLGAHGEQALRLYPPQPGQRVLDIGCGFGDTTQRIARLVGPEGSVVGVDAAARFIETARREARGAGIANAEFAVADVQRSVPGGAITIGADIDEAIEFLMALGPAGEILRLQGDRAAFLHDRVRDALAGGLADLVTPGGVIGQASTWIVRATTPGAHDA
jgi:SAM-dependent methyltransferase